MGLIDVDGLEEVAEVEDHVFELFTSRAPLELQHLGYIDRSRETIEVPLKNGQDLQIRQSLSSLSSSKETSSTGFLCWQSSALLVDWLLNDHRCPFFNVFNHKSDISVVELGTGIGGILAIALTPYVSHYIATDQKHILKLLKHNFTENIGTVAYDSSTVSKPDKTRTERNYKTTAKIDIIEYDWEYPEDGWYNYTTVSSAKPNLIVACDTVYNEYLIEYFVSALLKFMDESNGALVALQLREESIMESFVQHLLQSKLKVYCVPESMLSKDLKHGFVIYYITLQKSDM